jgi:hypothetical protein
MTLREEIAADNKKKGQGCTVCAWLAGREDADEWREVYADDELNHHAVWRAMKRRGYPNSTKPIESHRKERHDAAG